MRQLSRVVLMFAISVAGGLASAADKVDIAFKPDLQQGSTIRDVSDTQMEQTLSLAGMNIDTSVESHAATLQTVAAAATDGKKTLNGKFEYFIVSLDTPIGKFAFDSSKEAADPNTPPQLQPLVDLFRATSKAEWTSVLNARPEIEKIEFVGNPFEGLDPNSASEVTPQRFMDEHNNRLRHYPDGPVAVGDTWQRSEEAQIGGGQSLKFTKEFTYLGAEEKSGATFDKVGVKSLSVDYTLGSNAQPQLKLENSKLEIASSEGTLLYNRKLKMFTSEQEKLQIKGTLNFSIELNGKKQELPGELDLTIDARQTSEPVAK